MSAGVMSSRFRLSMIRTLMDCLRSSMCLLPRKIILQMIVQTPGGDWQRLFSQPVPRIDVCAHTQLITIS